MQELSLGNKSKKNENKEHGNYINSQTRPLLLFEAHDDIITSVTQG